MTNNQRRIPFVPKFSSTFEPMKYCICKFDVPVKMVTRSAFMHLLKQQPYPLAQVNIDLDGGYVYLLPYSPEYAEGFIQMNREVATAYKRDYRYHHEILTGKRQRDLQLDQPLNEEGLTLGDTLADADTPESIFMAKEHLVIQRASYNSLPDSDKYILNAFLEADCNARELARRLGKDPSGMLKLVKRVAARLEKRSKKIPDPMSTFRSGLSEQENVRPLQRQNGGGNHGQSQSLPRTSESIVERRKPACPI